MPEFTLPVTDEEYEKARSKFITSNVNDPVGTIYLRDIEMGMPDWDTPGQSIKFPVTVTEEGVDAGKEDKISCGVGSSAIWKLKEVLENLGVAIEMKAGADKKKHPVFDTMEVAGKAAVGRWTLQQDSRSADEGGKGTKYPKLTNIYPEGYAPSVEELT